MWRRWRQRRKYFQLPPAPERKDLERQLKERAAWAAGDPEWEAAHVRLLEHLGFHRRILALRDDQSQAGVEQTVQVCRQQIAIAPSVMRALIQDHEFAQRHLHQAFEHGVRVTPFAAPEHLGYRTLVDVLVQRGQPLEAHTLCMEARLQGWHGDWDAVIERLRER